MLGMQKATGSIPSILLLSKAKIVWEIYGGPKVSRGHRDFSLNFPVSTVLAQRAAHLERQHSAHIREILHLTFINRK